MNVKNSKEETCWSPAETHRDLLSHIQNGYQLETDSLGGNPVLRRLKDNEEMRPLSANRNTIKAMEQRGLISPGKGRGALTIAWRLKKKINQDLRYPATGSVSMQSRLSATHLRLARPEFLSLFCLRYQIAHRGNEGFVGRRFGPCVDHAGSARRVLGA
jgi:hypothetical protein